MPTHITAAKTEAEFAEFARLVRAYVAWACNRYSDNTGFTDAAFGHQSLDNELNDLARKYTHPAGRAFLVWVDGQAVGCGAYRSHAPGICEMKRVFIDDAGRGMGLGRALCNHLIAMAGADGYRLMQLDTARRLKEALALYHSLGFRATAPYNEYPTELRPEILYLDRVLDRKAPYRAP